MMNIIWLRIGLRDYVKKHRDIVEKIENYKIESLVKNKEFLVKIDFLIKLKYDFF
jgi:hypothetical protein